MPYLSFFFFLLFVFIASYHHSPRRKLWPGTHFCHAGVHSSLITPFRWYKLGLSRPVSMMDYRGQYETHWSISWISCWVSRQRRASAFTHSRSADKEFCRVFVPQLRFAEISVWVTEETSHTQRFQLSTHCSWSSTLCRRDTVWWRPFTGLSPPWKRRTDEPTSADSVSSCTSF